MAMNHFDLIVIGAGSGGIAAARRAASYKKSVLLIEERDLGGTCVNRGCVPKKVGFNLAQIREFMEHSNFYGLEANGRLDYEYFKNARDKYISRLHTIYGNNLAASDVQLTSGKATFLSKDTIEAGGQRYSSDTILIAVGGQPRKPSFHGAELIEDSDDFFRWNRLPKSVALVGSGYIACELSSQLQALGAQTSLIFRKKNLLSSFPSFLGETLKNEMASSGIALIQERSPARAQKVADQVQLEDSSGQIIGQYERVLWAAGREPNIKSLQLDKAGITPNPEGFISVDEHQQTSSPNIFAVGDVTGIGMLTPYAINRGRALADWLYGKKEMASAPENIPTVIFSHPPIGSVGLSEKQAKEKFGMENVKVYNSAFKNMLYALSDKKPVSKFQIVVSGPEEKVVGIHMIGYGSDEILQGFAAAMSAGATKAHLDQTLAIHPTAAEELVLMR